MIKRHLTSFIKDSLKDFPAVLINGARQVGKSTLAQQLTREGVLRQYITLDDFSHLEAAKTDPHGFVNSFDFPVAIDEIQRAPDLLRAIKKSIDEDRTPGRFLLTGSANIFSYPGVSESLAGRVDVIHVEGLSLGEILERETPSSFLTDLFSGLGARELSQKWNRELQEKPKIPDKILEDIIFYGGFPEVALKKEERFRERWFSSYQSAYIERDVRDINRFLDVVSFAKLFRLVGLQTGNLLNHTNLSAEIGLDKRTTVRYLEILEMTFQASHLRPWFSNSRKRLIKTPKIYLNDAGQACYLNGIMEVKQLRKSPHFGALFETWMWSELRKLLALTTGIDTSFYRTHLGREVDFLLSRGDVLWGIECKSASSVDAKDFQGLHDLKDALSPKTVGGIVLYKGDQVVPFGENFLAVPLSVLSG